MIAHNFILRCLRYGRITGNGAAAAVSGTARAASAARTATTKASSASASLVAKGPVAKQLEETRVWSKSKGGKKLGSSRASEPRRVNIVSKSLCDDIIKYVGPSLERHRGCDLIDLNPGAGVWSQALHTFLEPRKHVMMEGDAELYQPFLKELLEKPNVEMVNKSGLVWKELFEMMRTSLDRQEVPQEDAPRRNDTLLVSANLSMYPKKAFRGFDSISTMVLYQFMSSIRHSSLFQRYGLVRMLIWVNDDDKKRLIPRSLTRRKRSAFEAEISCEWVHEICGKDAETGDRLALRDDWINLESAYDTAERMEEMGLAMPAKRETMMHRKVKSDPSLKSQLLAGVHPPSLSRPFKQELEELEAELSKSKRGKASNDADASTRLKFLRIRDRGETAMGEQHLELLQLHDKLCKMARKSGRDSAAFHAADAAWNDRLGNLIKNQRNEFNLIKDNYHLFRQSPPALLWDRRAYEPLAVSDTEFYPNAPTSLLDIQPKSMNPLFREFGPETSRAGDMSDTMLRFWFSQLMLPMKQAMDGIWAGFGEQFDACPSLTDPTRGGSPVTGGNGNVGALKARCVNEEQWSEVMQAWMDWPFRPEYTQMLGRLADESEAETDEEETKSGAAGVMI